MKQLYKISLAVYLLFLLWLLLFKFSSDPISVIAHFHSRSINLIPFVSQAAGTISQMIENIIVFIPLGLLLSMSFKNLTFWRKLAYMFGLSVAVEITQYILAIGATDITDIITNTLGGFLGLAAYDFASKHINNKRLNQFIIVVLAVLLLAFTYLRFFVLRVKY